MTSSALSLSYVPPGISRLDAPLHVGIGKTVFDWNEDVNG